MYRMIIDTETANGLEQPLPYDVGYIIVDDETAEIMVERSYIVAEIFFDAELMSDAYYAEKIPQYWDDIKNGKRKIARISSIRRIIAADCKKYNIRLVGAYNMGFDRRAIKNDIRFCTGSALRWFFPYNIKYFDVWTMACTSILQTPEYIIFCETNGLISEKGNILTSAEAVYRYLQNDISFTECHTGLEDVRIEKDIFFAVLASGLDYEDNIQSACWQKVQKFYKIYKEKRGE